MNPLSGVAHPSARTCTHCKSSYKTNEKHTNSTFIPSHDKNHSLPQNNNYELRQFIFFYSSYFSSSCRT